VVSSAKSSGLNSLAELTINWGFALSGSRFAPGAPSIKLVRPPLLCEEGNSLREFNSFTAS